MGVVQLGASGCLPQPKGSGEKATGMYESEDTNGNRTDMTWKPALYWGGFVGIIATSRAVLHVARF